MSHQSVSLGKYRKLFPTTLSLNYAFYVLVSKSIDFAKCVCRVQILNYHVILPLFDPFQPFMKFLRQSQPQ